MVSYSASIGMRRQSERKKPSGKNDNDPILNIISGNQAGPGEGRELRIISGSS